MEMFIFKCLITLSVIYNVTAVAKESSEGGISTKVNTQSLKLNDRSKRQRNQGYYDYMHYLLDRHAQSADEHLAAHKPFGPYKPYEMHVFPHGLTHSSGEIRDHCDDRLQQGVNIFPGFGQGSNTFAGLDRAPNIFPGFGMHRAINTPSKPIIERAGRRMTYSSGAQANKPNCNSNNESRTVTKPKLRHNSQERNHGAIDRNCTLPYRKPHKTKSQKQFSGSKLHSHLANQNSQQNATHIVVLHLGGNKCSCSQYAIKSTDGSRLGSSDSSRNPQVEPNPVQARFSGATGSAESDSTEILGSDVGDVSASISATGSKVTTHNSSVATTVSVPVPASGNGSDFTPASVHVSELSSSLATNSDSAFVFGSTFGTTSVLSSSSGTSLTSAADPRSSATSTLASFDTVPVSAATPSSNSASAGASVDGSSTTTDPSLVSTSFPASTHNPRSASTSSPESLSVSDPSSLPSSVPGSVSSTIPRTASTSSSVSSDVHSTVTDSDPDSKPNATITAIPTTAFTPILASSGVTPSVVATVTSSRTESASDTGLDVDAGSRSAFRSTLTSSDDASSVSKHVLTSASEFKSISSSKFSSHSNSTVLSDNLHQSSAIGTETTPSSTHPTAMAGKVSSHDDFEPIPTAMDDLRSTFVLSDAQKAKSAVNQSKSIEARNMDLMSFLDNLERIDSFSQTGEVSTRTANLNSSTKSQTSTKLIQTSNQSNTFKAETHVASINAQNSTSNTRNIFQQEPDTIPGDSHEVEFVADQGDHIVAISGTSMDLNETNSNSRDMHHTRTKIEELQTMNDNLTNESEPSHEIFFDDISEAENNPSPTFEGAQDGDGTSSQFTENFSSSSLLHGRPVNETTEDVTNIPIKFNGKFKSMRFGSGSTRTIAKTEHNIQDTLELETGNSKHRLNDMTGTGSRFVNILRSPNEKASEATFAEPLVPGVYTAKKNEFKYKSRSPPSIYWYRIEPKSHTTDRHLKELRPFESADFEDVRFSQDCLYSEEFPEESRSAELKPRYPELFDCHTHLT